MLSQSLIVRQSLGRSDDDQVVDRRLHIRQRDLEEVGVVDADGDRFDSQGQVLRALTLPMPLVASAQRAGVGVNQRSHLRAKRVEHREDDVGVPQLDDRRRRTTSDRRG